MGAGHLLGYARVSTAGQDAPVRSTRWTPPAVLESSSNTPPAHRLSGSSWPSSSTRRYRATSCARSGALGALVAMNAEVATLAARPLPALVTNALGSTRSLVVALAGEGLPT